MGYSALTVLPDFVPRTHFWGVFDFIVLRGVFLRGAYAPPMIASLQLSATDVSA